MDEFNKMRLLVIGEAEVTGRCCWLFLRSENKYDYSFRFMPGWLFKAYPGGRRQLSVAGKKHWDGLKNKAIEKMAKDFVSRKEKK